MLLITPPMLTNRARTPQHPRMSPGMVQAVERSRKYRAVRMGKVGKKNKTTVTTTAILGVKSHLEMRTGETRPRKGPSSPALSTSGAR